MENRHRYRAWHKEEKYVASVRSIDFNTGRVNLNGADICDIDEVILMQCTGLKDKTGKLIYEGDIVKFAGETHRCDGMFKENVVCAVEWDDLTGKWRYMRHEDNSDYSGYTDEHYVIIGNIYETEYKWLEDLEIVGTE